MLEYKIKELRNCGFGVEGIVNTILLIYNENPWKIWLFKPMSYDEMKKLVINVLISIE